MSRKHWTDEKLFSRLINNKSDRTYWDNIWELRSRCNDEVFAKCSEFCNSDSIKEKLIGIDVLAQLGVEKRPFQKETLELFFELLAKENDSEVLMSILYGIGHNNYETLTETQINFLTSFKINKNNDVRAGLVSALLGVENSKAVDILIFLMNDKISSIRDWATFGIGTQIDRNNKKIKNALWERINDNDQVTKLEAIVGLAKRKDNRVKEIIIQELVKGEIDILLIDAIEELNEKDLLPLLKKSLLKYKNNKARNQRWLESLENCINKLENPT